MTVRSGVVLALLFGAVPLIFIAAVVVFQLAVNVLDGRQARVETVMSFATIRAVNAVDEAVRDTVRLMLRTLATA